MNHPINPEYLLTFAGLLFVWTKVSQDRTIARLQGKLDALNDVVMAWISNSAPAHGPRHSDLQVIDNRSSK